MTSRGCTVFLVLFVIVIILQSADSLPSRDAATSRGSSRRQQPSERDQLPPYHWQCPRIECPPVSNDCETIEFLVYAFQYRLPSSQDGPGSDGQATVSVHCESCRYCIDRPPRTPSRSRSRSRTSRDGVDQQSNRRRRFAVLQAALGQQCRPVQSCPRVSAQCRDVRLTRVQFAGATCRVPCPACYDTVPIPDQVAV